MTDLEKKYLDKTKEQPLSVEDQLEITELEIENADKAALLAVSHLRANLKNKEDEGKALWRFIRYLTEIEMPMQIIDFTGLLFPGNEAYYSKSLTPTAFKMIQQQASLMIANEKYDDENHKNWLQDIANGKMPYGYSIMIEEGEKKDE